MEHIELAGVHSGDSACILPSRHISAEALATIKEYTRKIAEEMHVVGLMNMQYAIENGKVFVLEANPRASRTVPLVSKVCGIRMVPLAVEVITAPLTGRPSPVPALKERNIPYYGVKEAVFPFNMFPEVDPVLGPEMRSTGEVLGIARTTGEAFFKAEEAAQARLPLSGTVLLSVNDRDKPELPGIARGFAEAGFRIIATGGTWEVISKLRADRPDTCRAAGIPAERVNKIFQGRPHILDLVANEGIQLIVDTPGGEQPSPQRERRAPERDPGPHSLRHDSRRRPRGHGGDPAHAGPEGGGAQIPSGVAPGDKGGGVGERTPPRSTVPPAVKNAPARPE